MSIHDKATTQLSLCCAYTAAATVHENQDAYAVDVDNFRFVITDGATGRPRGREWATHLAQFWVENPDVTPASWLTDLIDGFQDSQDGSVSTLAGLSLSSDGSRVMVDGAGDCFCLRVSKEHGLQVAFHGNIESAISSDQSTGLDITRLECPADSGDYFILASDAIGHLLTARWATKSAEFIYRETERFIDQDWDTFVRGARLGSYGPTLVDDDVTIVICKATVTKVVESSGSAPRKLTLGTKVAAVAIVCIALGITLGWMVKGPSDQAINQVASEQSSVPFEKRRQGTQFTELGPKNIQDSTQSSDIRRGNQQMSSTDGPIGPAQNTKGQQRSQIAIVNKDLKAPVSKRSPGISSKMQPKIKLSGKSEVQVTEKKPTGNAQLNSTKQSGFVSGIRVDGPVTVSGFEFEDLNDSYSAKVTISEWKVFIVRNKVDRRAYQRVGDHVKANRASAKKYIEWRNKVSKSSTSSVNWRLYDGQPEYNALVDCVHKDESSLAFIRAFRDSTIPSGNSANDK